MGRALMLDKSNGKFLGVCAGIANYFDMDALWIRQGFVAATLIGFGSPVLIYLVIALVANRAGA